MSLTKHAKQIFNAALQAVQPAAVLPLHIRLQSGFLIVDEKKYEIKNDAKIFAVAIGKASSAMMDVLYKILGKAIERSLVITKKGHAAGNESSIVIEADHPLPGEKSADAAITLLKFLNNVTSKDILIFLISGGASSLVTDVPASLSLGDIRFTNESLLLSGANIYEINIVRKHLSGLKGGRLVQYCNRATVFSFIINDVAGNDVSVIGSGLTAADNSSKKDALQVVTKYNLLQKIPAAVVDHLRSDQENLLAGTIERDKQIFKKVKNIIIADNKMALQNAAMKASDLGYHVAHVNYAMFGSTVAEATRLAKQIIAYKGKKPVCFLAGGETTIHVKGNGTGGRNQHFSLTVLHNILAYHDEKNLPVILAAGTDGTDGPTNAAGAIINPAVVKKIKKENISLERYLLNNDSYNFFKRTNGLFITGPTQTNVMDVVIALLA